jgi:hypothetical protein
MGGNERLDPLTEQVAAAFARCGFAVIVRPGSPSVGSVLEGVRRSEALSVLLSAGGQESELRAMTAKLYDAVEYVMTVGKDPPPPAQQREGDIYDPFRIHPDEGEERMARIAEFVRRGLLGSPSA